MNNNKLINCICFVGFLFLFLSFAGGVQAAGASLTLEPSSGIFEAGEIVKVKIMLDTGGSQTDGAELYYLRYPSNLLQVQDEDSSKAGVQIKPGSLYPNTLNNNVLASQGKIDFSQVTAGGQHFSGSGVLAAVTFKVLSAGTAELYFDFEPSSSIDCNIAAGGSDVLTKAVGAEFSLQKKPEITAPVEEDKEYKEDSPAQEEPSSGQPPSDDNESDNESYDKGVLVLGSESYNAGERGDRILAAASLDGFLIDDTEEDVLKWKRLLYLSLGLLALFVLLLIVLKLRQRSIYRA